MRPVLRSAENPTTVAPGMRPFGLVKRAASAAKRSPRHRLARHPAPGPSASRLAHAGSSRAASASSAGALQRRGDGGFARLTSMPRASTRCTGPSSCRCTRRRRVGNQIGERGCAQIDDKVHQDGAQRHHRRSQWPRPRCFSMANDPIDTRRRREQRARRPARTRLSPGPSGSARSDGRAARSRAPRRRSASR